MTTPAQPAPGAKPISIKVEPWTDYPKQAYSIHSDDFVHTKPFVAKFAAKGSRSTLNIKQTVSSKDGKFSVEDDVKLWFDLPSNHSLYTRVKSSSYIKIHYDHGLCEFRGKNWNLYGSFWTDKSFSKTSVRLGAASYAEKCQSDNRLRINSASGNHHFYWYHRTLSTINNWKLGLLGVVDISNRVIQKNNVLIGHSPNKNHELFLRLENDGYRSTNPNLGNFKTIWDSATFNYVAKADRYTKVGLEASVNISDLNLKKVEIAVERQLPEQNITLKAKLSHKYDFAFVFKRALWKLENLVTLSAGFGVNNFVSDKRVISQGIQLDFNI